MSVVATKMTTSEDAKERSERKLSFYRTVGRGNHIQSKKQ
jgi:hypothetical protein